MEPINHLSSSYPERPHSWCARSRGQHLGRLVEHKDANSKVGALCSHPINSYRGQELIRTSISTRAPAMIKTLKFENELILYFNHRKPSDEELYTFHINSHYKSIDIKVNLNYHTRSLASFFYDPESTSLELYDLEANPQKCGIGSLLLYTGALFAQQQKLNTVIVHAAEENAYTFYQQCGFEDPCYNFLNWSSDLVADSQLLLFRTGKMVDVFNIYQLQEQISPHFIKRWKSESYIID